MKRKINIYSQNNYPNKDVIYECSMYTNLNCSQALMKFIANIGYLPNVKDQRGNNAYLYKPITDDKHLRNNKVVRFYSSYK